MNTTLVRASAIFLHLLTNFFLLSWLMDFDLTGQWLRFALFVAGCFLLLWLLVLHFVSFIRFIKSK